MAFWQYLNLPITKKKRKLILRKKGTLLQSDHVNNFYILYGLGYMHVLEFYDSLLLKA